MTLAPPWARMSEVSSSGRSVVLVEVVAGAGCWPGRRRRRGRLRTTWRAGASSVVTSAGRAPGLADQPVPQLLEWRRLTGRSRCRRARPCVPRGAQLADGPQRDQIAAMDPGEAVLAPVLLERRHGRRTRCCTRHAGGGARSRRRTPPSSRPRGPRSWSGCRSRRRICRGRPRSRSSSRRGSATRRSAVNRRSWSTGLSR